MKPNPKRTKKNLFEISRSALEINFTQTYKMFERSFIQHAWSAENYRYMSPFSRGNFPGKLPYILDIFHLEKLLLM